MNTLFDQLSTLAKKAQGLVETGMDWAIDHREWTILIISLMVAALFRLWGILPPSAQLPVGIYPAEAQIGLLAKEIASGNLMAPEVGALGSSVVFIYLQSLLALFSNTSALMLRIIPALLSIVVVVMTYLAAKSWFSKRAGLIAIFFMAASAWAAQISRLGMDFSLAMLILPTAMWLLAIAVKTNKARHYTATGLVAGLGLYIYPLTWIIPLSVLAILTYSWFVHKDRLKRVYKPLAIILLGAMAMALPLAIYSLVSSGINASLTGFTDMFSALLSTLMMLHINGDPSYMFNLPTTAHLNAFTGILFILGLILAFTKWRNLRYASLIILLTITVIVAVTLEPGLAPSATMLAPAMPIIYLLAAVGLSELLMRWRGVFPFNVVAWHIGATIIVLSVGFSAFYNYNLYFVAWANSKEAIEASYEHSYEMAQYILEEKPEEEAGQQYLVIADEQSLLPIQYLLFERSDIDVSYYEDGIDISDQATILLAANEESLVLADKLEIDTAQAEKRFSELIVSKVLFYVITE